MSAQRILGPIRKCSSLNAYPSTVEAQSPPDACHEQALMSSTASPPTLPGRGAAPPSKPPSSSSGDDKKPVRSQRQEKPPKAQAPSSQPPLESQTSKKTEKGALPALIRVGSRSSPRAKTQQIMPASSKLWQLGQAFLISLVILASCSLVFFALFGPYLARAHKPVLLLNQGSERLVLRLQSRRELLDPVADLEHPRLAGRRELMRFFENVPTEERKFSIHNI